MADGTTKKVFDNQSILYALIDTPVVQSLYLSPESALKFPQRLVNNNVLKNCIPGEETNITRNSYSDMLLFYLKQLVFSAMVPDIRLYKVRNTKNDDGKVIKKEVIEIEIPKSLGEEYIQRNRAALDTPAALQDALGEAFESLGDTTDPPPADAARTLSEKIRNLTPPPVVTPPGNDLDLSRPLLQRSGQIGIKSFEWNYQGQNPFSAERDIQATLTLSMDGMGALNAVRTNKKGQKYRILDVMIQADCFKKKGFQKPRPNEPVSQTNEEAERTSSDKALKYDPGCYEILIEAGYFIDEAQFSQMFKLMGLTSAVPIRFTDEEIVKAFRSIDFKKMKSCMYLNTTDHSFTFGENGKVDVTINYVARSMTADKAPEANILFNKDTEKEITSTTKAIEIFEALVKDIEESGNPKVINTETSSPEVGTMTGARDADLDLARGSRSLKKTTNLDAAKTELRRLKERKQFLVESARNSFFSEVLGILLKPTELSAVRGKGNRVYSIDLEEDDASLFADYLEDPKRETLAAFRKNLQDKVFKNVGSITEATKPEESDEYDIYDLARDGSNYQFTKDAITAIEKYLQPLERKLSVTPFVFLGDVLDAVIQRTGKDKFKEYRYILSNVKIKSPLDESKPVVIPIGGIPITVELLRSIIEKEIKASKKTKYTLLQFIRLMLNKVLGESLGRQAVKISSNNNINFKTTAFLHYGTKRNPDPTRTPEDFDVVSLDPKYAKGYTEVREIATIEDAQIKPVLLNLNGACSDVSFLDLEDQKILNIIVIHENSNRDFSKRNYGNLQEDFKRFIPHYVQGQAYGLIKKVTLEKQDIPQFRETRFEQAGGDDPDTYLTNFYNATFDMIGNDLNTLGSYIYFDPYGLAPDGSLGSPNDPSSLSYIMGLGGVHLITKISHRMSPGDYTTIVKTRWENRGALKQNNETGASTQNDET